MFNIPLDEKHAVPRHLSDIALWEHRGSLAFPPFLLADKELERRYTEEGYNPMLYRAYRNIFPSRSKFEGSMQKQQAYHSRLYWYADLIEYNKGVLASGELFRSTGHWNNAKQVEIFQTLKGSILMIIAGSGWQGQKYLYQRFCSEGDMCVVPPGAWHLTYVVDGPSLVFNMYTNADETHKYARQTPVEVAIKARGKEMEYVVSQQARHLWGEAVPHRSDEAVLSFLQLAGWLTERYLYSSAGELAHLERGVYHVYRQGWPADA